jgi:hypothetical protein
MEGIPDFSGRGEHWSIGRRRVNLIDTIAYRVFYDRCSLLFPHRDLDAKSQRTRAAVSAWNVNSIYKKVRFKMRNHTAVAMLPILRPGKRQAGPHLVNSTYVFSLLLSAISFCAPAVAQTEELTIEDGTYCSRPNWAITILTNNPIKGGIGIEVTCMCINDPSSDSTDTTWVCHYKEF